MWLFGGPMHHCIMTHGGAELLVLYGGGGVVLQLVLDVMHEGGLGQ